MITHVPHPSVGSIWSVTRLHDTAVVVLSGPFSAAEGVFEYLVLPLYKGDEPGFLWSSDDVLLSTTETGLDGDRYAAIWNARPILEADLGIELGTVQREVTELLKDFYWASVNDRDVGHHDRLGKEIRSPAEAGARFQARELERWEPLSGRVFMQAISPAATFVRLDEAWTLTSDEIERLWQDIEESERLLGEPSLDALGQEWARLTALFAVSQPPKDAAADAPLFRDGMTTASWLTGCVVSRGVDRQTATELEPTSDHLAEAA
jgi:hypothetical protein